MEPASITIPTLRTGEFFSFQIIAKAGEGFTLSPTAYSDTAIGVISESGFFESDIPSKLKTIPFSIAYFVIAYIAIKFIGETVYKSSNAYATLIGNVNNTAFVLAHLGESDSARRILETQLERKGVGPYEFSNLALCHALEDNFEKADLFLDAAAFLQGDSKWRNISLNRGLVEYLKGEKISSREHLSHFKAKHEKIFNEYMKFSPLLRRVAEDIKI
jgi:hypothetical protein